MKCGDYRIKQENEVKLDSYSACPCVPYPNLPALKNELNGLVDKGIIKPINYSTPWLNPNVVLTKKGETHIGLCVDFSKLNNYAVCPVNLQPTPCETVSNLTKDIKHFAVLDALKGYHQILLDESKDNTAFWVLLLSAVGLWSQ
jgi:hypothetical protein